MGDSAATCTNTGSATTINSPLGALASTPVGTINSVVSALEFTSGVELASSISVLLRFVIRDQPILISAVWRGV